MAKVFLISSKTLKTDGLINDNVGDEMLKPAIQEAQDIFLQQIIGTKLMNKVCDMVGDGTIAQNSDYKLLLDEYITPYLNFKVMASIQIPLAYKMRNLGIVQTNDNNIYNVNMNDVKALIEHYDNRAGFYSIRLTKFLSANNTIYPEYMSTDSCADFRSNKNTFECPVFLG